MDKGKFRDLLMEHLNNSEFKNLCQDIYVDYDALDGSGLNGKIRELIEYLDRRGRLDTLLQRFKVLRPHIPVDKIVDTHIKSDPQNTFIATDIHYLIHSLQNLVEKSKANIEEEDEPEEQNYLVEASLHEIALFLAALPDDRSRTDSGNKGYLKNFREGWNKGSQSKEDPNTSRISFNRVSWRSLGWFIGALVGIDKATSEQTNKLFASLETIRNSRIE